MSYPPDIDLVVAAQYRHAVDHDADKGSAPQVLDAATGVRWTFPHNYYVGSPVLEVDGALGAAAGDLVYDAHVRLGTEVDAYPFHGGSGEAQRLGVVAGFGLDAIGSRIPRAWTVPVDAYWFVRSSEGTRVGVIAGPRFAVAGADRGFGWRAGVDFAWRDVWDHSPSFGPRDIHIRVSMESFADVIYGGVSLSVASRRVLESW
jgi:hypothetical protein